MMWVDEYAMSVRTATKDLARWSLGVLAALATVGQPAAQTMADSHDRDEIVVTAQRSGVPVWRVGGATTTVVLVGSIGKVTPGIHWDPAALDAALAQADRIMFPEAMDISFGLFSVIGLIGKWRAQASLPKGQTLQALMTAEQWTRLVALRDRGILKPGFERQHPYHLAMSLARSFRDRRKLDPGADAYVRRYLDRNKAKEVPLAKAKLKAVTTEFFASAPRTHVPCLMDYVARVEAGEDGLRARAEARRRRSVAWAERRVPAALTASADERRASCWPVGGQLEQERDASLVPAIRNLMSGSQRALAVVSLDTLARPGGVLDALVAAGFDVRGPRWRP